MTPPLPARSAMYLALPRACQGRDIVRSMRDIARIVAVGATALAVAAPAAAIQSRASVGVTDLSPVTVKGTGFKARESVTVRVAPRGASTYAKVVRATSTGRIVAVFSSRALDQCMGYTVTAAGNRGSRARKIGIPPPCGIEIQP